MILVAKVSVDISRRFERREALGVFEQCYERGRGYYERRGREVLRVACHEHYAFVKQRLNLKT